MGAILARAGRRGVLLIDALLLRINRVEVFADDPDCILRCSHRRLGKPVVLSDGTGFRSGDVVIELHFWNEHLPFVEDDGADALWGRRFSSRLVRSLGLLGAWAATDPRYERFVAIHGQLGFIPAHDVQVMKRLGLRFGFLLELREAPGRRFWRAAFWGGLYSWWLMWAFNPNTLRGKRRRDMALCDLWMTRDVLVEGYRTGDRHQEPGQPAERLDGPVSG